jgi:hypothetical protein
VSDTQRLPREQAVHVEYGAHIEPQLRVALGERFVIETNDNWFNLLGEEGATPSVTEPPVAARQYLSAPTRSAGLCTSTASSRGTRSS